MFLQELLKKHVDLSEEELISLTNESNLTHKVPIKVRFDGEGCFTLPIKINNEYIEKELCDSRANCNLMSLTKARELEIRRISPYPYTTGYANGHEEEALGVLKNFPLNIGGFDYCLDIVVADTRGKYEFPLILGRKFFAQVGLLLDVEQGETTIRTSKLYDVFSVTYSEYDASQTFEWRLIKEVVDDFAQRKIEEEEVRGYPSDEDYEFEEEEEIKEPEG